MSFESFNRRQDEYEAATGQRFRHLVPLSPKELYLGAFSMALFGALFGYMAGICAGDYVRPTAADCRKCADHGRVHDARD